MGTRCRGRIRTRSSIPVGGSVTLTANGGPQELGGVPYWVASAGDHTVDAYVNGGPTGTGRFPELDRSNNHLSQGFSVGEPAGRAAGLFVVGAGAVCWIHVLGSRRSDGLFAGVGAVGPGQTLNLMVGRPGRGP